MNEIEQYFGRTRTEFFNACRPYIAELSRACGGAHPEHHRGDYGLARHTLEVVKKALELNPGFDEQEIIETCLAHDLRHWDKLPLRENQVTAIQATRGLPWKIWRRTPHYRFVALVLIADMWSAYVNIGGK